MEMLSKLHLLWRGVNPLYVILHEGDFHHLAEEVTVVDHLMVLEGPLLVDLPEGILGEEEEAHLDVAVQIVEEVVQVLDLGLQIEEKEVILLLVQDHQQKKEEVAPGLPVEVDLIPVEVDLDPNLSNHL